MKKDFKNFSFYEKKIISSFDRFSLNKSQLFEMKKDLNRSKILVVGAAGSIGNEFTKRLMKRIKF